MLLQTNSYIVPKDKRAEHARLMRRFRQVLNRLGCDDFEIYEQVGANWSSGQTSGRYVQIMRFRDRRHQVAVQNAERSDQAAQELIAEFCALINYPLQQQQQQFAVGFYNSVLPVAPVRPQHGAEEQAVDEGGTDAALGVGAGAAMTAFDEDAGLSVEEEGEQPIDEQAATGEEGAVTEPGVMPEEAAYEAPAPESVEGEETATEEYQPEAEPVEGEEQWGEAAEPGSEQAVGEEIPAEEPTPGAEGVEEAELAGGHPLDEELSIEGLEEFGSEDEDDDISRLAKELSASEDARNHGRPHGRGLDNGAH